MDTTLLVQGPHGLEAGTVWRGKTADQVIAKLPAGDYDLVEVEPDGGASGCPVISGQLWDEGGFTNPPPPPAPRRPIPKSTVQERLIALGKADAADAALEANKVAKFRWFAPNHPNVFADDEGLLSFLSALGLTAGQIGDITA
jgi:hypothetical protein